MVNKKEMEELRGIIKSENEKSETRMTNIIKKESKTLEEHLTILMETKIAEKVAEEVEEIYKEMEQRKEKERNVVIYGLKEKRNENLKNDIAKLMNDIELTEVIEDISFSSRMGKPQDSKNRPVKVGFLCTNNAEKVLKNAKKLKDREEKIYINEDLTQKQMKRIKEMKEDALLKNQEDTDLKNGEKWIVVGRRSPRMKKVTPK